MRRPLLVAVFLTTVLACGGGTDPTSTADIDGTWVGNGSTNGTAFNLSLVLVEDGGGITGHGTISGSGPTCGVSVAGVRHGSTVSMNITCPGFQPFGYSGSQRSGARIEGHFEGSGVPRTSVVLNKV